MDLVTRFGPCPVCGDRNSDYPASQLTSADAQDNLDTTGNGLPLEMHKGKWMCWNCKRREEDRSHGRKEAKGHEKAQSDRSKIGIRRTIEE